MNNRTNDPTGSAVTVAVCGANNADGSAKGSPLLVVLAAGAAVRDRPPSSRRENATAVHINGATAGPSPLPPVVNHDSKSGPRSATEPASATRGDAVITGGATEVTGAATAAAGDEAIAESIGATGTTAAPLTGAATDALAGTSTPALLGTSSSPTPFGPLTGSGSPTGAVSARRFRGTSTSATGASPAESRGEDALPDGAESCAGSWTDPREARGARGESDDDELSDADESDDDEPDEPPEPRVSA
ncbi:hypothetical protein [Mycolicibacterium sp.]|uniref:hypothetical protein n=1 Tax=Mycolicibacterium sp. TaxID=2320850 RepID=UPI0028A6527B|nr:hypothetical protein [Mycolicibacterium sp.]